MRNLDELDAWLIGIGLAALAAAVMFLSWAMRDLRTDLELLRITAAVPAIERH